jgi:tRNA nucleotidyltransferase (CCA-adding enzyme)
MNKKFVHIEKNILKKITPTVKEKAHLNRVVQQLKNTVENEVHKRNISATVELVGSIAKDTYLQNNLDIDIFLLFQTSVLREALEKNGLSIGRAVLQNTEECYAEHPYVRGVYKNYKTEIVPCYAIESVSQKLSAVDRTPLHTRYVVEHLRESQKQEVRLLKQFLRGISCYGAEAEIEGFSGYLCEMLIMNYGSFHQLIDQAQKWQYGEKLYLTAGEYPDFETPLTFIDPVDSKRNVASALSREKFDLFKTACNDYLQKPSSSFFFPTMITPWSLDTIKKELKKQEGYFVGITLAKPDIIAENLYPQVRKAVRSLQELCERYDFTVLDTRFHVDDQNKRMYIILKAQQEQLSNVRIHSGPPVQREKNAHEFRQKWYNNPRVLRKPYEKEGKLYVELEREYKDITILLEEQVGKLSLGKHITEIVKKGYRVLAPQDLLIADLALFWTSYLDKKKPWERQ